MNSVNYRELTLAAAISKHDSISSEIARRNSILTADIKDNPNKLDTENISFLNKLLDRLRKINAVLEEKKNQSSQILQQENKRNCFFIEKNTYIIAGIELVLGALAIGFLAYSMFNKDEELNNLQTTLNNCTCSNTENTTTLSGSSKPEVGAYLFESLVVIGSVWVVNFLREARNDRDQAKLELVQRDMLLAMSRIEEKGDLHYQDFLKALEDFKKSLMEDQPSSGGLPPAENQQKETMKKCVDCYRRIPILGWRRDLPSQEHTVSSLIEMLPDDHSIKGRLRQLKEKAMQIIHQEISSSEDDDRFEGETMAINQLRASGDEGDFIPVDRRGYRADWTEIEDDLGFRIDNLALEGSVFNRKCQFARTLEELQPPETESKPSPPQLEIIID